MALHRCCSLRSAHAISRPPRSSAAFSMHAGEGGLIVRFGTEIDLAVNTQALALMNALDSRPLLAGVKDVLPSYASLLVNFDPLVVSTAEVEDWCRAAAKDAVTDGADGGEAVRVVEIPVHYGGEYGPDIEDAAQIASLGSASEVARVHSSGDYRVFFLGFTGGFPYLGGLPSALATVPRLATPRQQVPKGAVGIAAGQTGVYTLSTPGGWHVLGRTSLPLFDPAKDPPALLQAGDTVKFVPTDDPIPPEAAGQGDDGSDLPAPDAPWMQVMSPGPMTTVQDVGRHGYARHGVSRSGAADDLALRMGNALLRNDESAAGLEVTMGGLKLRCDGACAVALTGADCGAKLHRAGVASMELRVNEVIQFEEGDELQLGFAKDGARGYVCVQGGVDVPPVLGSRSTDVRAGLGGFRGRSLRAGDALGRLYDASAPEPRLLRSVHDPLRSDDAVADAAAGTQWTVRVLPGPGNPSTGENDLQADELAALTGRLFSVTPRSDRMAVMVNKSESADGFSADGATAPKLVGGQQMSEACVSGTVQLPPDGQPVILLAEHQTTGGYKVPAVVIQADLWRVAQMRPGDTMQFVATTPEEAAAALQEQRKRALKTELRPISGDELNLRVLARGVNQVGLTADLEHLQHLGHYEAGRLPRDPHVSSTSSTSSSSSSSSSASSAAASSSAAIVAAAAAALSTSSDRGGTNDEGFAFVPRARSDLKGIDLNADCGEGFDDAGLLEFVTSVNIACGGHVGTPESLAKTVRLAAARGAGIGAHVAYPDHEGFGRVPLLEMSPLELRDQILWQASALDGLCRGEGARVRYIKPHGALYHTVMAGGEQAEAVHAAARLLGLPLLLMPRSPSATYGEGFAERAYDGDSLRPRDKPGALIHDPDEAAAQAVALAARPDLHSVCVHGDSPNAVAIAKVVRAALDDAGYLVRPFV